ASTTPTTAVNTPRGLSGTDSVKRACSARWAPSAMPTTTPWPRASSPASRRNSSTGEPGRRATSWPRPSSSTWKRSTTRSAGTRPSGCWPPTTTNTATTTSPSSLRHDDHRYTVPVRETGGTPDLLHHHRQEHIGELVLAARPVQTGLHRRRHVAADGLAVHPRQPLHGPEPMIPEPQPQHFTDLVHTHLPEGHRRSSIR